MPENTQIVMVTGAARRIGAAIARHLHHLGMKIAIHYRSSHQEASALARELNTLRDDSAILLQADLHDLSVYPQLFDQIKRHWGRLDVLVNNASSFYPTNLTTATLEDWEELLSSNLRAPYFLSQQAMPFLSERQACIINITDIHADTPLRDYSMYCIAKAGLVMLTKCLAKELGPNIRVNAVAPGAIAWPEGENAIDETTKLKIIEHTALKRAGNPEAIAKTVGFLIRDADYITGQVIAVDGGRAI